MSVRIRSTDVARFEFVKQLILQDLKQHYSITALSRASSLNEFKLKVGFKLLYKKSLYEFLQDHRMQHALLLLRTTEDTIQHIAEQCGYGYSTNFTAVFRKKFKLLPSDYRKSQALHQALANGQLPENGIGIPVLDMYRRPDDRKDMTAAS